MEVFGIDVMVIGALSVFVTGIVQWFKSDLMPSWAVRLISLAISFAIVALFMLLNPLTWQEYVVYSFGVFFGANGLWHVADQVGRSVNKIV